MEVFQSQTLETDYIFFSEGETINLIAADLGDVPYSWNGPNGFTSTDKSPTIPNATESMEGDYTLTVQLEGCGGPTTDKVSVTVF